MRFLMSVIRIAVVVAVINGTARAALVYWSYYQLKDAAQQLAVFGWQAPPELLRSQAFSRANELFIPITEDQIVVTRNGPVTVIEAQYEHLVEYFPHRQYPLKLSFTVEGRNITSGSVQ
jgi:hypothetical protein